MTLLILGKDWQQAMTVTSTNVDKGQFKVYDPIWRRQATMS